MQRAARSLVFPLLVERVGNAHRIGVQLDHAVDNRAALVDCLDVRGIQLHERTSTVLSRLHAFLEFGNGFFVQLE